MAQRSAARRPTYVQHQQLLRLLQAPALLVHKPQQAAHPPGCHQGGDAGRAAARAHRLRGGWGRVRVVLVGCECVLGE